VLTASLLPKAFGWDLDAAVSMHLEGNQTAAPVSMPPVTSNDDDRPIRPAGGASNRQFGGPRMDGIGGPDNDVPPMPGSDISHQDHLNNVLRNLMQSSIGRHVGNTDDNDGGAMDMSGMMGGMSLPGMMAAYERSQQQERGARRTEDQYDEDGIRLPDPVQRERLVGGFSPRWRSDREEFGRAEDPSIEWMFPPPRHLSSQLPLDEVRDRTLPATVVTYTTCYVSVPDTLLSSQRE
jgi:hypothetical protein